MQPIDKLAWFLEQEGILFDVLRGEEVVCGIRTFTDGYVKCDLTLKTWAEVHRICKGADSIRFKSYRLEIEED